MRVLYVCVFVCLVFAAVSPNAAQPTEPLPPTAPELEEAYKAGLYTSLDLSQTIDGTTVALSWAYADPWLIQIGFMPRRGGRIISATLRLADETLNTPDLGNGFGHPDAGWFEWHGRPALWDPAQYTTNDNVDLNTHIPIYDAFETIPETLDLALTVEVEMPPPTPTPDSSAPTLAPEVTPEPTSVPTPVILEFEFLFTVKVNPLYVLEPNLRVETDAASFTLEQVAFTPVKNILKVCMDVSNSTDDWIMRDIDLYYGENEVTFYEQRMPEGGWSGYWQPTPDCGYFETPIFRDPADTTFSFDIGWLQTVYVHSDDKLREIQSYLKAKGKDMTFEVNSEGKITTFSLPEGVRFEDVAFDLGMIQRIEGPWTLTVPIPEE